MREEVAMDFSSSCNRPCPSSFLCGHHRGRKRCQANLIAFLSTLYLMSTADQADAFHGRVQREDDIRPERQRGAFLQTLSRVAERGASKWGDYVTSTKSKTPSMKKSSAVVISQLHRQIQNMKSKNSIINDDIEKKIKRLEEGNAPPEHLIQEILAYMLGGAAAGSAFAAATAGAFVGTAVVALGAIGTAVFKDEAEELLHFLVDQENSDEYDSNNEEPTLGNEGCDFNGGGQEEVESDGEMKRLPDATSDVSTHKLSTNMLEELKRCYAGTPGYATTLNFPQHYSKDICIVDGNDSSIIRGTETQLLSIENVHENLHGGSAEANIKLASAIEEACSSTQDCDHIMPSVEDEAPKRVEVVWHDANTGAKYQYYTKTESMVKNERHRKRSQPHRALSKSRSRDDKSRGDEKSTDVHWATLTDGEREGALLLSESFRAASSAIGLVADAVRFTGETAAATVGGASRLAGGAVRVSGWAIGSLGDAIENGGGNGRGHNGVQTSEKIRKRQVAGSSVQLIGGAIEQVADSLLLAGSATERVAFAAAGAAEGTVRIVEDFASSLSDLFSKEGRRGTRLSPPLEKEPDDAITVIEDESRPIAAAEDTMVNMEDMIEVKDPEATPSHDETDEGPLIELFRWVSSWILQNMDAIHADTVGVSSVAPEMLGVFLLCFLASVLLLNDKKASLPMTEKKEVKGETPKDVSFHDSSHKNSINNEDHDTHSTLTDESTMIIAPDYVRTQAQRPWPSLAKRVTGLFFSLILMPIKLAREILARSWSIAWSKKTALLMIYMLGWIFLSRVSQYKSSVIQRKSEFLGYKLAIQSIGKSSISLAESAVWLNTILYKLWRVESGGLEPLFSSSISASLAESLEHPYSKPNVVAHVSLESFTFGSSPPIISRLEMKGVDDDQSVVYMNVDVGMLLHDSVLLLDIKPSSLEYRSLPSTKVSINSLDAKATLSLAVKCSPNYPYVSFVNISLADIPDFSLRIEPQSESGLKGIDFGSFPVISKWIKSSINTALADYLSPAYISVDILAWLKEYDTTVTYFGG